MPARKAEAEWKGNVTEGKGRVSLGSGAFSGPYDFRGRTGDGAGTNPEELIGAAHAGCFTMALSAFLGRAGFTPDSIHTVATVHLEKQGEALVIPRILLTTQATVPNISAQQFQTIAEDAKKNCPVSRALAGVEIQLEASLAQRA